MPLENIARRFGNELYKFAFPIYRLLYGIFKRLNDRTERELLARQLSPGSVVVDAGANIGVYSRFFAGCVGSTGVVHSFEPDQENFERLCAALVGLPNVRANRLAVSDKTGESALYVSDHLNVDHRAYPTAGEERRMVSIQSIRLDDYFPAGDRVDFIKMDIQGFELHALRGAERVLKENRGIKLLLEVWPYGLKQAGGSAEDLLSFLREREFSIRALSEGGSTQLHAGLFAPDESDNYFNIFALRGHPPRGLSEGVAA